MRISLLLEREPFPEILEQTLSHFWSRHFGRETTVHWHNGRPYRSQPEQIWLVNSYLNAIFVVEAEQAVFDPIKREFLRSPIWWKRPFQHAYVQAAAGSSIAPWLTQAYLTVSPAIPQSEMQIVIAGNHKVRWLDMRVNKAYGIRKVGFHDQFMRQEIEARQKATACGVPVPTLYAADDVTYNWFCEPLISGTPINRIADKQQARKTVKQLYASLTRLYANTTTQLPISQYANELQQRIVTLVSSHHLLTEAQKTALCGQTQRIATCLIGSYEPVTLALTHGDFQQANMLVDDSGNWLIDWEYATRRQIGYDALVFGLGTRFQQGMSDRLQQYVTTGEIPNLFTDQSNLIGMRGEVSNRVTQIALFLLEEIEFTLMETSQPLIKSLGSGWAEKKAAIMAFVVTKQHEVGNASQ